MMLLQWQPGKRNFVLRVPRGDADVTKLVTEAGLDLSTTASTASEAVLFTNEPYAAAMFAEFADDGAAAELAPMVREIDASRAAESASHFKMPQDQELWPYQRADLDYALRRDNCLIGDQPGLGKTPTSIVYANEIGAKRVLVLCPANIRLQWAAKIREWTTMKWPYNIHVILQSKHGVDPEAEWTVVSYDLARTEAIGNALARGSYDLLILDEAHYLKDITSKRTRATFGGGRSQTFEPLANRCAHVLALTGTPLPNRPREAYTLARNLCWDAVDWLSEDGFKERFNPSQKQEFLRPDGSTGIWVDERSGRHAELQNRLRANMMTRHLKRDVLTQLKLPQYDIIQVEEDVAIRKALLAESLLDIDPDELSGANAEVLGHIAVVRREMGIAIAPHVADYVSMLIEGGEEKLVLFGWHIEVLNILEQKLHRFGLVRIDGSTSSNQREKRKLDFINNPRTRILLGNIQAIGIGTDGLQAVCTHGLIAEPSWTPGDNIQAFDRLDRFGQKGQVQGDIFVAPGSVAERILASALRKLRITNSALDKRTFQ